MIEIRFATPEDAALMLQFIRALAEYERLADAVKVDEATLRAQLSAAQPPFECLIAQLGSVPAGFALFFSTYSTWLGKSGIWLEDLFVLPTQRKHGVGGALLSRLGAIATERGCGRLEWSVLDWNQLAIDFYVGRGATVMSGWRTCRVEGDALSKLSSAD